MASSLRSLMTVSRVVNGESGVTPETAARVERAIRRLGYQRNDMARHLRRTRRPLGNACAIVSEPMTIQTLTFALYLAIALIPSFALHEYAHAWAASKKSGGAGTTAGNAGNGGGGGGGALSRFAAASAQDDSDRDSRAESDGGEHESMDEDVASVASSQGDS